MDGVNHSARTRSTYQGAGFPPGYKRHTRAYSEGDEEHNGQSREKPFIVANVRKCASSAGAVLY